MRKIMKWNSVFLFFYIAIFFYEWKEMHETQVIGVDWSSVGLLTVKVRDFWQQTFIHQRGCVSLY